jgi:methionyl-tRNA formyltransferase
LRPCPAEEAGGGLGLVVTCVDRPGDDDSLRSALVSADLALVVDFGRRVPEDLLSLPRWGCLNIHPSLLPEYRGAAPVPRALLDGRTETGVTLFRLVGRMDAGPILDQVSSPIAPEESAGELLARLADLGTDRLLERLDDLPEGWRFREQDEDKATPAPKLAAGEARLDWSRPSTELHRQVRAFSPEPGAHALFRGGRLKIRGARVADSGVSGEPGAFQGLSGGEPLFACGSGILALSRVQPEGKRPQSGAEWAAGRRLAPGDRLE